MNKIAVLLAAVFMFGCSTPKHHERKVSTDGSPTVLSVKSPFTIEPGKKYNIKKDKLTDFKLPNFVTCYVYSKAKAITSYNVADKIEIMGISQAANKNGTVFDMGSFDLMCTQSIGFWNNNPSFQKMQKELKDFATFE